MDEVSAVVRAMRVSVRVSTECCRVRNVSIYQDEESDDATSMDKGQ